MFGTFKEGWSKFSIFISSLSIFILICSNHEKSVSFATFITQYVYGVEEYHKKSFRHLNTFFMSNWFGDCKSIQEIEFPQCLFELQMSAATYVVHKFKYSSQKKFLISNNKTQWNKKLFMATVFEFVQDSTANPAHLASCLALFWCAL